jgi:hypothetical protein
LEVIGSELQHLTDALPLWPSIPGSTGFGFSPNGK